MEHGADVFVGNNDFPILGWPLANGKVLEIFRHLIGKCADVNFKYTSGRSLLLKTAQLDRGDISRLLLEKGAVVETDELHALLLEKG